MVERRSTSVRRERRQASAARRPPRDYLSAVRTHGDAHRRSSQASHTHAPLKRAHKGNRSAIVVVMEMVKLIPVKLYF